MNEDIIKVESDEFQDTILKSVSQHRAPYVVDLKGVEYVIFPETFNPNYAKASLLLLNNLGVKEGDVVLDPFTGCGADAVFAALEGASKVIAIDKFTMPYLCTKFNVHKLKLDQKIDVRQGDLFEPLDSEEKFDLIIANPPFREMDPESDIAAAIRDKEYTTLKKFFREVGNYLKPNGRLRIVFSDVGDMALFHKLAKESDFETEIIAKEKFGSEVRIEVYEMRKIAGN